MTWNISWSLKILCCFPRNKTILFYFNLLSCTSPSVVLNLQCPTTQVRQKNTSLVLLAILNMLGWKNLEIVLFWMCVFNDESMDSGKTEVWAHIYSHTIKKKKKQGLINLASHRNLSDDLDQPPKVYL